MKAYFAEEDGHKRDAIAVRQLHALNQHQGPREKALRLRGLLRRRPLIVLIVR
jgi:hypothetical protein